MTSPPPSTLRELTLTASEYGLYRAAVRRYTELRDALELLDGVGAGRDGATFRLLLPECQAASEDLAHLIDGFSST